MYFLRSSWFSAVFGNRLVTVGPVSTYMERLYIIFLNVLSSTFLWQTQQTSFSSLLFLPADCVRPLCVRVDVWVCDCVFFWESVVQKSIRLAVSCVRPVCLPAVGVFAEPRSECRHSASPQANTAVLALTTLAGLSQSPLGKQFVTFMTIPLAKIDHQVCVRILQSNY